MSAASAMAPLGGLLAPSAIALIVGASVELAIGVFAALLLLPALSVGRIDIETKGQPLSEAVPV